MAVPLVYQSLGTRIAILSCFWLAIILSIPSWLRLTTIQRLPLPNAEVVQLQASHRCPVTFHSTLSIRASSTLLSPADDDSSAEREFLEQVEQLVQQSLMLKANTPGAGAGSLDCTQWSVDAKVLAEGYVESKTEPEKGQYSIRVLPEASLPAEAAMKDDEPTVYIPLPDTPASLPLVPDTISAAVIAELLHLRGDDTLASAEGAVVEQDPRVIQYSKHVRLVFSIMNQDITDTTAYDSPLIHALGTPSSRDPIWKMTDELRELHTFHVETQVQWFAPLHFQPTIEHLEQVVEEEVEEEVWEDTVIEEEPEVPIEEENSEAEGEEEEIERQLKTRKVKESRTIRVPRKQRSIKQTRTPLPPRHVVEWDDLKVFVNSEEWALTSTVPPASSADETAGGRPFDVLSQTHDLHFLLYVPSRSHSPLVIRDANGTVREGNNAWLIPQWGGVVILNPTHHEDSRNSTATSLDFISSTSNQGKQTEIKELAPEDVAEAIQLFSRQLSILLGLSSSSSSSLERRVRVEMLKQRRTLELGLETRSTLSAITHLVDRIPNLGVGPAVKQDTESALHILSNLSTTQHSHGVFKRVREANAVGKRAFFNPDMLGLLYFPDEHKYAVYTPLFAPLLVPLIVTTIKLLKEVKESRGQKPKPKGRKST